MPANVGEMFYTGEVPWHGEGIHLAKPATVEEALKVGGLDWAVGEVDLMTADDPPSPVSKRKALVRLDRPAGRPDRVLGVAHRGYRPLQNRDGTLLFDAIFGRGEPVYHTGGYLGVGEVVWLLAEVDKALEIGKGDILQPYALFANGHDGSMAFHIRLTTVRVVCQNTLSIAVNEKRFGEQFRRAHQGTFREHAEAAQEFFKETLGQFDSIALAFTDLSKKRCPEEQFKSLLQALFPDPKRPRNAERNPGLFKSYEKKLAEVRKARQRISELREAGKGMDLPGAAGTFWGVLNAVMEYLDYGDSQDIASVSYTLLGDGMDLKMKAFRLIRDMARAA